MRISWKILLTLLVVAVLPVTVSGAISVVLARDAVTAAASEKLESEALHLAEVSETTILGSLDDLRQSANLGFAALSPQEREGALWVIYRADAARSAVALVDDLGQPVVPAVYQQTVSAEPGLADHEPLSVADLDAFAEHIPLGEALAAGKAISVPYADAKRGSPLVAIAVRVPGALRGDGKDGAEHPWVVAAELSLAQLNQRFVEAKDDKLVAYLLDLASRTVCHSDVATAVQRQVMTGPGAQQLVDAKAAASGVVPVEPSDKDLIAYARVSRLAGPDGKSWGVVVTRDRREALSAVDRLSQQVAFWVGTALLLSVLAGVVLARGIARPIEVLASFVQRFASAQQKAQYASQSGSAGSGADSVGRAPPLGRDEIGMLARQFNTMADDIDEYTHKLREFNTDLQRKVEDRTRELKQAQTQLIQSQKMAAVGELGAGVAHEINNPLAGVLGSAQLALLRVDKDDARVRPHLEDIEKEALRIKDIVDSLLKLSHDQGQGALASIDVNQVVEGALALLARPIIAQRIHVKKELGRGLPKIRGKTAELQQAVMQLLTNAKDAMASGGTLTIKTEQIDGQLVKISVDDTGHGVPETLRERIFEPFFTTRASKGHKGMGLAIVHRVVEEHGGRVNVVSEPDRGASFRLIFPAAREGMHLV